MVFDMEYTNHNNNYMVRQHNYWKFNHNGQAESGVSRNISCKFLKVIFNVLYNQCHLKSYAQLYGYYH